MKFKTTDFSNSSSLKTFLLASLLMCGGKVAAHSSNVEQAIESICHLLNEKNKQPRSPYDVCEEVKKLLIAEDEKNQNDQYTAVITMLEDASKAGGLRGLMIINNNLHLLPSDILQDKRFEHFKNKSKSTAYKIHMMNNYKRYLAFR